MWNLENLAVGKWELVDGQDRNPFVNPGALSALRTLKIAD